MKPDLESLSAEPLFYMLMHSGVFVMVLGGIFFIVGLLFGRATWGRYKRQAHLLNSEGSSMKQEIADLKRKLADHTVKTGQSVAIATETIHMPPKEGSPPPSPAVPTSVMAVADDAAASHAPAKSRVAKPRTNTAKPKQTAREIPAPVDKAGDPPKTGGEPATASIKLAAPSAPPPPPAQRLSPLAAIIATPPEKEQKETSAAERLSEPVPPEIATSATASAELPVTPMPVVVVLPESDPKLGLVYKTKPEKVDDLTALKGIAKVLEQRLHELGVYTYEQIAAWTDDHVREFSVRLSFKDRILRERWVEQARQLGAKKNAAKAA